MAYTKNLHRKAYRLHSENYSLDDISSKLKVAKRTIWAWSQEFLTCNCHFHNWPELDTKVQGQLHKIIDKNRCENALNVATDRCNFGRRNDSAQKPIDESNEIISITEDSTINNFAENALKQQQKMLQNDYEKIDKIVDDKLESLAIIKFIKRLSVKALKSFIKTDDTGKEVLTIPLETSKDLGNIVSVLLKANQEERLILGEPTNITQCNLIGGDISVYESLISEEKVPNV